MAVHALIAKLYSVFQAVKLISSDKQDQGD